MKNFFGDANCAVLVSDGTLQGLLWKGGEGRSAVEGVGEGNCWREKQRCRGEGGDGKADYGWQTLPVQTFEVHSEPTIQG